jgi:hypothetical protein
VLADIDIVLKGVQLAKKLNYFSIQTPTDYIPESPWFPTPYNFTNNLDPSVPFPPISSLSIIPIGRGYIQHALIPRFGGPNVSELLIAGIHLHANCFLNLLADMPNIEKLTLDVTYLDLQFPSKDNKGWGRPIGDRILLPRLKKLYLQVSSSYHVLIPEVVLRCGPAIHHLSFPWHAGDERQYSDNFVNNIQNVPDTVLSMEIDCSSGTYFTAPFELQDRTHLVTAALERLPRLESLNIKRNKKRNPESNPNVAALVYAVDRKNMRAMKSSPPRPLVHLTMDSFL